jgi:hypothetical protein
MTTDGKPGDPLAALGAAIASASPVEWPAGIPEGPWETVSVHTLELPAGWPPGCRCVLSDGVRVSLGGPCPAHPDVSAAPMDRQERTP